MFRLLEFLKSKGHLILFIVLEIIAVTLLYRGSNYHTGVLLSSTNVITGRVTEIASVANSYIGLREANIDLMNRNAALEREVLRLRNNIERLLVDSLSYRSLFGDSIDRPFPYGYMTAKVVGNILYGSSNYITIDKGSEDGIHPDMGVVGINGIVGVVQTVSRHYAKVIPVINKAFAISCKVGSSEHVGVLKWNEQDITHSQITNLPKHVKFEQGDSVFTSSYSAIFPENIFIGTIEDEGTSPDDNFYALKVKLNVSFDNLKYVYVIVNYDRKERTMLEVEQE